MNIKEKETTILMCHLKNSNHPSADGTGRKVNYSNKKESKNLDKRNKFLDKIFEFLEDLQITFSHILFIV